MKNVYAIIIALFKSLKHFSIIRSSIYDYPPLVAYFLPPMTFSPSTLTKLCINVLDLCDVYALLDGRLKQLTTLIIQVNIISNFMLKSSNRVSSIIIVIK
jgi:hypothetical protein